MAATPAQTLIAEGAKFSGFIADLSAMRQMKLALLVRTLVALDPNADTSPQTLLAYAKCYACYGISQFEMVELALLDLISQNA